ncbi:MAG: hypothetical protein N3E40_07175, partial [Dehalococcoidia bacterium]|nr:hypothetical protein [Dehalococcoidia bacterium]
MIKKVAIIYNAPEQDRYSRLGEGSAVVGVMDEVRAAARSLVELGYEVERVPIRPPLHSARDRLSQIKADLVFNIFEGF